MVVDSAMVYRRGFEALVALVIIKSNHIIAWRVHFLARICRPGMDGFLEGHKNGGRAGIVDVADRHIKAGRLSGGSAKT